MAENDPLIRRDRDNSELDFDNRDPNQINDYVIKVNFEDVIAEPAGTHSPDSVWKCSYRTFTESKHYCYSGLVVIIGIPLSLLWGLLFAILPFCHIWFLVPIVNFAFKCLIRPGSLVIRTICDPFIKGVGKLCSGTRGLCRKTA